jgi:hypothetical protein
MKLTKQTQAQAQVIGSCPTAEQRSLTSATICVEQIVTTVSPFRAGWN